MAKKSTTSRSATQASTVAIETPKEKAAVDTTVDSKANAKANMKPGDETSSGQVGLAEIKKAVAFVNSVGGLDKALAVLQILKVAKDVQ